MSVAAVRLAAVLEVEDQDHQLIVADFVEDAPGASPHPPRARVTDELGSLPRPGVLGEPVDDALHLLLNSLVESLECLAGLVAYDDFVGHRVTGQLRP